MARLTHTGFDTSHDDALLDRLVRFVSAPDPVWSALEPLVVEELRRLQEPDHDEGLPAAQILAAVRTPGRLVVARCGAFTVHGASFRLEPAILGLERGLPQDHPAYRIPLHSASVEGAPFQFDEVRVQPSETVVITNPHGQRVALQPGS